MTVLNTRQEISREGRELIDLGRQYLLPELVNLHVHFRQAANPERSPYTAVRSFST